MYFDLPRLLLRAAKSTAKRVLPAPLVWHMGWLSRRFSRNSPGHMARQSQPGVKLVCDRPQLGATQPIRLSGPIEIYGWALAPQGAVEVRVFVDGRIIGVATDRLLRRDVADAFPQHPHAIHAGFCLIWQTEGLPEGLHRLRVEAGQGAAKTFVEGLIQIDHSCHPYQRWLRRHAPDASTRFRMRREWSRMTSRPLISILMPVPDIELNRDRLARTLRSVQEQAYEHWELLIAPTQESLSAAQAAVDQVATGRIRVLRPTDAADLLAAAGANLRGQFLTVIDVGDLLRSDALLAAARLLGERHLDLVYSDEDLLAEDKSTPHSPFCKPDWSPDLFLGMNYIGRLWLARTSLVQAVGGFRPEYDGALEYDLLLRLTEHTSSIGHLPTLVYSRLARPGSAKEEAAGQRALQDACRRRGIDAQVSQGPRPGLYRVRRATADNPMVSAIIPTRGGLDLLGPLLQSMDELSSPALCEIILMVASATEISAEVEVLCARHRARIIRYERSGPFNWSWVNNQGAIQAKGDYLLFLNDDMKVLAPGWIEALLEHAQRPDVAAVGGKLLYRNGTIQHAGVFLCEEEGGGRHSFRFMIDDPSVYFGYLFAVRNSYAVTGACIMVRKQVFQQVGGFDESLGLICNDMDYCLRAWQRGFQVIWTPFALLQHDEGTTRMGIPEDEDARRFWFRWRDTLSGGDPFYNHHLSQRNDAYAIRDYPHSQDAVDRHVVSWVNELGQRSAIPRFMQTCLACACWVCSRAFRHR